MGEGDHGARVSNFATLVRESQTDGLSAAEGRDIIDHLVSAIRDNWDDAAEVARLSAADKESIRNRSILPRAAFFNCDAASL